MSKKQSEEVRKMIAEQEEEIKQREKNKSKPIELVPEVVEKSKDPIDARIEADMQKESEQFALVEKARRELEEIKAKERLADQEEEKNRQRYNAEFTGELPRHKELRQAYYLANKPAEKERILREYFDLHYQIPARTIIFKKVVTYECEEEGIKLVMSNGKLSVRGLREDSLERFRETPKVTLDSQTGLPIMYTFLLLNDGLYKFKRSGQYVDIKVEVEE